MAWSTPTRQPVGTTVSAATWNQDVKDNIIYLHDPPAARVYHNTTQTATSGVNTVLSFNSEVFDNASLHDTVTNNSRLTAPQKGIYVIWGNASGTGNAGIYQLTLRKDGTGQFSLNNYYNPSASVLNAVSIIYLSFMAASSYMELQFYQNSGSTVTVDSTGDYSPRFAMQWIGSND